MTNIIWLILTILLWGFLHSLLASNKTKSLIIRDFGESHNNQYRIFYNIIASLSFLPILWLMFILPDKELYFISMPWIILARLIQLISLLIMIIAAKQTGIANFVGIKIESVISDVKEQNLKTGGLYRYVRHPIYSAGLVLLWCSPVMTLNYLTVAICLSLYIFIGAAFEERKLFIEFGEQYQLYKENVPMFVPGLHWNKIKSAASERKKKS
jgi:protein-S-isoprenylcysteine O-methyltransferase Ste14